MRSQRVGATNTHMSTELITASNHLILFCPLPFLPSVCPSIRVLDDGNFRLRARFQKHPLLSYHQPTRTKPYTLQPSPQILPIKIFLLKKKKVWEKFGKFRTFEHESLVLLAWPHNKPFPAPHSDILLYLVSLCIGYMKSVQ